MGHSGHGLSRGSESMLLALRAVTGDLTISGVPALALAPQALQPRRAQSAVFPPYYLAAAPPHGFFLEIAPTINPTGWAPPIAPGLDGACSFLSRHQALFDSRQFQIECRAYSVLACKPLQLVARMTSLPQGRVIVRYCRSLFNNYYSTESTRAPRAWRGPLGRPNLGGGDN
jgi:hypothetical protein